MNFSSKLFDKKLTFQILFNFQFKDIIFSGVAKSNADDNKYFTVNSRKEGRNSSAVVEKLALSARSSGVATRLK